MVLRMENVERRGEVYYVRVIVPPDARFAFAGKTAEWRSLRTKDENIARERAAPIISDIKRRIATARSPQGTLLGPTVPLLPPINPDVAQNAIERWQTRTINDGYLAHFNGTAPKFSPLGNDAVEISNRLYALQQSRYGEIAGFDDALVAALAGEGIAIQRDHPAIPNLRSWFGESWREAESHLQKFSQANFSEWSFEPAITPASTLATPTSVSASASKGILISGLLARFINSHKLAPKDASETRGYVARLIQELGDVPIADVSTDALDRYLVRLRRFPRTKRPDILKLSFGEIIDRFGDDPSFQSVGNKTIRTKWFGAYNRLFKYALGLKMVAENPLTGTMPRKSDDVEVEREPWSNEEIGEMFSRPLFQGTSSKLDTGYRRESGKLVRRDAKYWLPIIALYSGMRLEEIGGTRAREIIQLEGHYFFDLRKRQRLKNEQSARLVPVHPKLVEIGLLDHANTQNEWLFPDLPHERAQDDEARTSQFSKWFGLWRVANGFPRGATMKDFHSFRHTFIDACRDAQIAEQTQDFITGHAGGGSQGRKYGKGMSPVVLATAMAKVHYETFPALPGRSI